MPLTPSHAVVALPLIRTPRFPAAIAVGAMTPDVPLFARGIPLSYASTHDVGSLPLTVWAGLRLTRAVAAAPVARILPSRARWVVWVSLPVALVVGWCIGLAVHGWPAGGISVQFIAYRALLPACRVWVLLIVMVGVTIQVRRGRGSPAPPADR